MTNNHEGILWVASFDIGKKNFSFYIEEFDVDALRQVKNINKTNRYNIDGTTTPQFENILRDVYTNGSKVLLENLDLTENCDKKAYLDPETYHNMTEKLDEYANFWDQCDIFVIEKQMSFGKKHNTMALKLGQHCYSYFAIKYKRDKLIVEFPAYYKTQVLGAEKDQKITKGGKITYKAVDKPARKKWSVDKAITILTDRDDQSSLTQINGTKKKDDLADVICQLQAYKYLAFIDDVKFCY